MRMQYLMAADSRLNFDAAGQLEQEKKIGLTGERTAENAPMGQSHVRFGQYG